MPLSLAKGQKISLNKEAGGSLARVMMGLGWDARKPAGFFGGGGDIDLDASCLMFNEAKMLVDQVWFRQLRSQDGSIVHSGDNLTGAGDGDDEKIQVDLSKVPAHVQAMVFVVNSFRGDTFDHVANAFCRLVDTASGKEIARYDLAAKGSHTGVIMAKLYRHNGEWKMHAIGEGATGRTFHDMLPMIQGMI